MFYSYRICVQLVCIFWYFFSIRPSSPSPSLASEKEAVRQEDNSVEKSEKEEEERRKRLQLYVFVMRCIAYPFNAKQPTDMTRRQAKVTRQQLQTLKERFQAFFNGELNIPSDEVRDKIMC